MTYTPPDVSVNDPRGGLLSCYHNEHEFGNDCIRIHGYTQNWYESESRCTRDRGHLLTIHSADENKKVMEWAANYVEPDESGKWHVWIGLDKNKDYGFQWTDHSALDFTHWSVGSPSGGDESDI